MSAANRAARLVALALAPLAVIAAEPAAKEAPARTLGAPKVMKLDWDVISPRAADLDGDGRTDLVALNNTTARVEVLLNLKPGEKLPAPRTLRDNRWEPVIDDAPYRRLSLRGSVGMGALVVADLDGDGRPEIAYTSSRDGLVVLSRDAEGEWTGRREYGKLKALPGPGALTVVTIDGKPRLAMLAKEGLALFPPILGDRPIPEPELLGLTGENAAALVPADYNGDGREDLAFITRGENQRLQVRFALPNGGFGPEHSFKTEFSDIALTRTPFGKDAVGFVGASPRRRTVEAFALTRDESPFLTADTVSPAVHALGTTLKTGAAASFAGTAADAPLLVADPKGSAIRVFRRTGATFAEPESFPSFTNLSAIAAGRFGGETGYFAIGEKGDTLGYAGFDAKGRLAFPKEIKLPGDPVAVVAAPIPGEQDADLAYVVVKTDKGLNLVTLGKKTGEAPAILSETPFEDADKSVSDLVVGSLDGRRVLLLLREQGPTTILVEPAAGTPGGFVVADKNSALRKGLLNKLSTAEIGFGDIDGDGRDELLVAGPGFVRALTLDAENRIVVRDQINTRRPEDKPRGPVVVTFPGDTRASLVFHNDTDKGLEVLSPDTKGVFRHRTTVLTNEAAPVTARLISLGGRPMLIQLGRDRIVETDLGATGMKLVEKGRFETETRDTLHGLVAAGNFTGGATPDLVLIDPRVGSLELVRTDKDDAPSSHLHFRLFSENPFHRGRRSGGGEPHGVLATDLTGDGYSDLVLLMHDRLLVYPSVPVER